MLKYLYSQVYTAEIPKELSLGIAVLGCPVHCPDCHSPHMWDVNCGDEGEDLTEEALDGMINRQKWISCILFFGGEWDMNHLLHLVKHLKRNYNYRTALYSGHEIGYFMNAEIINFFDYLKVGPYDKLKGSLIYPSTNQRLYRLEDGKLKEDITHLFWKTRIQ